MKKIIFITLITCALVTTNTMAEKIDCTQFDKLSAKYLECQKTNCMQNQRKILLTDGIEYLLFQHSILTRDSK